MMKEGANKHQELCEQYVPMTIIRISSGQEVGHMVYDLHILEWLQVHYPGIPTIVVHAGDGPERPDLEELLRLEPTTTMGVSIVHSVPEAREFVRKCVSNYPEVACECYGRNANIIEDLTPVPYARQTSVVIAQ